MKQIITIALVAITAMATAQTYRTVPKDPEKPAVPYDSLENIPTHIRSLYGQTALILKTSGFHPVKDYHVKMTGNSILNKKFEVIDAQADTKQAIIWITMASGSDTILYSFMPGGVNKEFVIMGFYTKQEQRYVDKQLKPRLSVTLQNVNTGEMKSYDSKTSFTCTGASMIENEKSIFPALILKTSGNEEVAVPLKGFERSSDESIRGFIVE